MTTPTPLTDADLDNARGSGGLDIDDRVGGTVVIAPTAQATGQSRRRGGVVVEDMRLTME